MAAADQYRVTTIDSTGIVEGSPVAILSEAELFEEFAPAYAGSVKDDPTVAKKAKDWLDLFLSEELIQEAHNVAVEKVSPAEVFAQKLAVHDEIAPQLAKAKSELNDALIAVLSSVTPEEIAKGAVHKLTPTGKKTYTIVDLYMRQAKAPAKAIAEAGHPFPEHVQAELKRVVAERAAELAAKTAGAKASK